MGITKNHPAYDRIRGVIFGHAIGDALGFGAEGMAKAEVSSRFEDGLRDYDQIRSSGMRALLRPGKWTDDTSQMLCILESLICRSTLDPKDVARKFTRWLVDDGFGCGQLMYEVLNHPEYLLRPDQIAHEIWEDSTPLGQPVSSRSAPNGAVMRTSVLGIWQYNDFEKVAENAAKICRLTHADPRCVSSCVAVCVAIAALLQGAEDVIPVITLAARYAQRIEPACIDNLFSIDSPRSQSLADLRLDEGCTRGEKDRIGYTYKTLSAGFWALAHALTFEDALVTIINEGGDADTNAAVAGALCGAKFGYSAIPERWIEGLVEHRYLQSEVDDLMQILVTE